MLNEGYIESFIIGEGIRMSDNGTYEISFSDIEKAFYLDAGSIKEHGTKSIREGLLNAKPFIADCMVDTEREIFKVYFKPEICLNMNRDPRTIKERNDMSLEEVDALKRESFELVEEQTYGHSPNFRGLLLGGGFEHFEELVFVYPYETPKEERLEYCYLIENKDPAINKFNATDIEYLDPDFVILNGKKVYDKEALFMGQGIKVGDVIITKEGKKGSVTFIWDFEKENPRYEIDFGEKSLGICEHKEIALEKETPKQSPKKGLPELKTPKL